MRAAPGADRDRRRALRALAGRRRRPLEPVGLAHEEKDGEGHDHEVEEGVDEHTVVERGGAGGLGGGQRGIRPSGQAHEQVVEAHAAQEQPDRGHEQVVDEGRHDRAEGGAQHDRHREVHHVAPHEERLELA